MDWEINEDRDDQIAHVLNPLSRQYMLYRETGNLSEGQLKCKRETIREKEAELPIRFQDLIDDLTIFYIYGLLGRDSWKAPRESVASTEIEKLCDVSSRISEYKGLSGPMVGSTFPAHFGFELGCALRLLFEVTDETKEYRHVLWGLLLSDAVNYSEEPREQARYLEDLLSEFRELTQERLTKQEEAAEIDDAVRQTGQSNQRTAETVARKVWSDAGFNAKYENIETFIRATYPSGVPMNSQESHEREFKKVLNRNLPEIEFVSQLESDIHDDAQSVMERNTRGVSTEALLHILLKSHYAEEIRNRTPPSREIQDWTRNHPLFDQEDDLDSLEEPLGINTIKKYSDKTQGNVTTALRQLKDRHINPQWPQHKVVEGTKEKAEWKLTGYGRVLAIYLFRTRKESKWMYEAVFNNTRIDSERQTKRHAINLALNEINRETDELNKYYLSRQFDEGDVVMVNIPDDSDRDKAKHHGYLGKVTEILTDDVSDVTNDEWFARLYRVYLETKNTVNFAPRDLITPDYEQWSRS